MEAVPDPEDEPVSFATCDGVAARHGMLGTAMQLENLRRIGRADGTPSFHLFSAPSKSTCHARGRAGGRPRWKRACHRQGAAIRYNGRQAAAVAMSASYIDCIACERARSSICTAPARAHPRPDNRDEEKPIHRLTRPQVSTSPQCFPLPQRGTAHTTPGAARRGALSAVRARPVA